MEQIWQLVAGDSPLVAAAIHDGHAVRLEVANLLALSADERLREEDPFTADWTEIAENRLIGLRSRFEVDLNRPREKAVYIKPEDAWELQVWQKTPPDALIARSLANYDAFYTAARHLFDHLVTRFGCFVVFDLHTYNHRREGPHATPAPADLNPEVNLGTGTMRRDRWTAVIERFMYDMRSFDFLGRQLDVRENVRFRGGHFARWTHEHYPETGCVLSIEFKKFFMDEWTGIPDRQQLAAIRAALQAAVPGVMDTLRQR